MGGSGKRFTHESLQDGKTIKALLDALARGFSKGQMTLGDDGDEIVLKTGGLMGVRIRAEQNDGRNELRLRVSWSDPSRPADPKGTPRIDS